MSIKTYQVKCDKFHVRLKQVKIKSEYINQINIIVKLTDLGLVCVVSAMKREHMYHAHVDAVPSHLTQIGI